MTNNMSADDGGSAADRCQRGDDFDPHNIVDQLEAIVRFLPIFEDSSFRFGEWVGGDSSSGIFTMPTFDTSEQAQAFIRAAYDAGWVYPFSWTDWIDTDEGRRLLSDPTYLAQADANQLAKLLTARIRADRFIEGGLGSDFESGLLINILRRAAQLLESNTALP